MTKSIQFHKHNWGFWDSKIGASIEIEEEYDIMDIYNKIRNLIDNNNLGTYRWFLSSEDFVFLQNKGIVFTNYEQAFSRNGYSFSNIKLDETKVNDEVKKQGIKLNNLRSTHWLEDDKDNVINYRNLTKNKYFASTNAKNFWTFYAKHVTMGFAHKFLGGLIEDPKINFIERNKDKSDFFYFEAVGNVPNIKFFKYTNLEHDSTNYEEKVDEKNVIIKKEESSGNDYFYAFLWYTIQSAWHIFYIAILIIIIYIEEIIEIIQETLKETAESNLARKRLINKKSKATRLANQAEVEGKIRKANRKLRKIKIEQDQEEMNFKQKEQIQKKK